MAIFFAGSSTQLIRTRNRMLALGLGGVMFVFAVYLMLTQPTEFSEL